MSEITFPEGFRLERLHRDVDNVFRIFNSKNIAYHGIAKRCRSWRCLQQEMNTLNKLKGVEHVPFVYYYFKRFPQNESVSNKLQTTREQFYLVMSKLPGKDLFTVQSELQIPECDVIDIITKILHILKDIHARGVIHGDLKLENVIYCPIYREVGLIDFDGMQTYKYNAPETMKRLLKDEKDIFEDDFYNISQLTKDVDIWGVGLIAFMLLERIIPFQNGEEILLKKVEFLYDCSDDAKNFIEMCLAKDKDVRPTVEMCLEHKWLKDEQPPLNLESNSHTH